MKIEIFTPTAFPFVREGDNVGALVLEACRNGDLEALRGGDVLAVTQKIASKAEGRGRKLRDVAPGEEARKIADKCGKDPRLVELILAESQEVVRIQKGLIITRHRLGFILANSGVDQSNVGEEGSETALLLPIDPDATCQAIRSHIFAETGIDLGIVMTDSFGRPWREGVIGTMIGVAGVPALVDRRGDKDLFGRSLMVTQIAFADAVAAAAALAIGEAAEGRPVALLRGLDFRPDRAAHAIDILRPRHLDLFS